VVKEKMVKFQLKADPQGRIYFPKKVREELGTEFEGLGNARAFLLFPVGTPIKVILGALEVIEKDLQHRKEIKELEMEK